MSQYPDLTPDPRKEQILERSPLLKAFLDNKALYDTPNWGRSLKEQYEIIEPRMKEALGTDYHTVGTTPLAVMSEIMQIYDHRIPAETKSGTVNNLTAIGFEIGDEEEAEIFLEDISMQLAKIGILDKNKFNPKDAGKIVDTVWIILLAGVNWKKYADGDIPDDFKDFLSKLDY